MRRARVGVTAAFAAHAVLSGLLGPWVPRIKAQAGLDALGSGIALTGFAIGLLAGTRVADPAIRRWGGRRVVRGGIPMMGVGFALLPWAGTLPSLTLLFFGIGLLAGLIDVAMNIEAVAVERRFERRVMSAIHGTWSVALFVGAALASAGIAAGMPIEIHLPISAALVVLVSRVFLRWLPHRRMRRGASRGGARRPHRRPTEPAPGPPPVPGRGRLLPGGGDRGRMERRLPPRVGGCRLERGRTRRRRVLGRDGGVALRRGSARGTLRPTRRRSVRRIERVRGARRHADRPSSGPVRCRARDRRPRPRSGGSPRVPDRRPDLPPGARERLAARGDRRLRGLDRRAAARRLHRRPGHAADRVPRAGHGLRGVGVAAGATRER